MSPDSVGVMGNDTLHIFEHYFDPSPPNVTSVTDFPLTQITAPDSSSPPWFGPSGLFGLGADAPILQRLVDQDVISTRSFGLYIGTSYTRADGKINGSLTLGGYDSGRFEGTANTYQLVQDYDSQRNETPFRVTVTGLVLNDLSNNGNVSTSLIDEGFDAYLTTDQYSMSFPQAATDLFLESTSTDATPQANDFSEPTFYLPPSANFSLTITLSSNLTITIPASELRNLSNASPISPPTLIPNTPARGPFNNSDLSNGTTAGPALLGTAFLSHVYLTANYDASPQPSFYLNKALPDGPYVMTQGLCADSVPVMAVSTSISSWNKNGTIGAILGGVIGGIALVFVGWWCWVGQRWRRGNRKDMIGGDHKEGWESDGTAEGRNKGVLAVLLGKMRRVKGKGKEKGKERAVDGGRYDAAPQRPSSSSSSISAQDEQSTHEMQHFDNIPVPAPYSHPNQSQASVHSQSGGRYYAALTPQRSSPDLRDADASLNQRPRTAPSNRQPQYTTYSIADHTPGHDVLQLAAVPVHQTHTTHSDPRRSQAASPLSQYYEQRYGSLTAASQQPLLDHPKDAIGRALTTPPLPDNSQSEVQAYQPIPRTHTPPLSAFPFSPPQPNLSRSQTLRSISPVSPISPLFPPATPPLESFGPASFPFPATPPPTQRQSFPPGVAKTISRKPVTAKTRMPTPPPSSNASTGTLGLEAGMQEVVLSPSLMADLGNVESGSSGGLGGVVSVGEARVGRRVSLRGDA